MANDIAMDYNESEVKTSEEMKKINHAKISMRITSNKIKTQVCNSINKMVTNHFVTEFFFYSIVITRFQYFSLWFYFCSSFFFFIFTLCFCFFFVLIIRTGLAPNILVFVCMLCAKNKIHYSAKIIAQIQNRFMYNSFENWK